MAIFLAAGSASTVHARELNFIANVNTTYVNEDSEISDIESDKSDSYSIQPSLGANYQSGRFSGSANIGYQRLDRHFSSSTSNQQSPESRNDYTTYTANSSFELLENSLFVTMNGTQTYRSFDVTDSLTDDEFNDDGSLSKTRRTQLGFRFKSPAADYFVVDLNGSVSNVKSDNGNEAGYAVNSNDKSLNSRLTSGDRMSEASWDLTSTYRETKGSSNNELTSETHYGNIYLGIYDELSFLVTARSESNKSTSATENVSNDLDFDSYGAGLSWGKQPNRRINLTYNRSGNASEDEKESFVGADINWAFTTRTSISAELSRRYFGKSGSFSLRHNSKRIRASINYTEDLTTFSRIIGSELTKESFVCPAAATDFSECFQAPSLDYELNAGEQFTSFSQLNPIISEEARLRKSLQSSIGYDFRRLKTTLIIRRTSTEFLDSSRKQVSELVGIRGALKAGVKTSFTASLNYQKTEDIQDIEMSDSEIWIADIGVNRTVGKNSRIRLSYSHNERKSNRVESLSTNGLTTNRITLSFNRKFN